MKLIVKCKKYDGDAGKSYDQYFAVNYSSKEELAKLIFDTAQKALVLYTKSFDAHDEWQELHDAGKQTPTVERPDVQYDFAIPGYERLFDVTDFFEAPYDPAGPWPFGLQRKNSPKKRQTKFSRIKEYRYENPVIMTPDEFYTEHELK